MGLQVGMPISQSLDHIARFCIIDLFQTFQTPAENALSTPERSHHSTVMITNMSQFQIATADALASPTKASCLVMLLFWTFSFDVEESISGQHLTGHSKCYSRLPCNTLW